MNQAHGQGGPCRVCLPQFACVPLSLPGPANSYLPNVCFPIFGSVAFLPSEVPNHYCHYPVFSWRCYLNWGLWPFQWIIQSLGLSTYLCLSLSRVWLFAIPWTVACQALLSMEFSGKSIEVGCHFLLQRIFLTQGSNPSLLHCRQILYQLSHQGSLSIR